MSTVQPMLYLKKKKKKVISSVWQTSALMMMPLLEIHAASFLLLQYLRKNCDSIFCLVWKN